MTEKPRLEVSEVFTISPNEKYLLTVNAGGLSRAELHHELEVLTESLKDWLKDPDEPFFVVGAWGGVKVEFAKIDKIGGEDD